MTWINLAPRQLLERMREEYPATFKAFELDRALEALEQETKYTMGEALAEFFRTPETQAPRNADGQRTEEKP